MIYKTQFKITVLSEEWPFGLEGGDNDPFDLLAINYAIVEGDCIGSVEKLGSSIVPENEVNKELLAIGNDGTFFNREK
jgi:hypothetical protein